MPDPFRPNCPDCGHRFSLADLKTMAIGDGWERYILVEAADGKREVVSFTDFNPATMKPLKEPV
jgi:hypothetical protein